MTPAQKCKILSTDSHRQVLYALEAGVDTMSGLLDRVGMSQPTLSTTLTKLENAGLIVRHRDGGRLRITLDEGGMRAFHMEMVRSVPIFQRIRSVVNTPGYESSCSHGVPAGETCMTCPPPREVPPGGWR